MLCAAVTVAALARKEFYEILREDVEGYFGSYDDRKAFECLGLVLLGRSGY